MRLYRFINCEYGLAAIRDQRLKLSTFDNLNDPFELYGATLDDRDIRETFKALKLGLSSTMGLLCCSKDWKSPLLWSHYADKHRGIALELEVEDKLITHVNYRKNRIKVNKDYMDAQLRMEPGKALGSHLLATKAIEWAYENEARIQFDIGHMDPNKKPFFIPFDQKIKLVGVVLGSLCTLHINDIRSVLPKGKPLVVNKARLAF